MNVGFWQLYGHGIEISGLFICICSGTSRGFIVNIAIILTWIVFI